uniref:Uncharacterized protein LOC111134041 n=1 Tax=Crassostrea virginica TaxID=6565 RepID=A0A8B8EFX3_CRAVI|nr:uncharacterized protein LOC111134041 [Crassostrea virginica]
MTPFGLFGVWVLVFGIVQSKISLADRVLSDVDVKNLLQRLAVLEESLKVEKERNDKLEKTVNVLATNLEQTKRMFDEKCTGHLGGLRAHKDEGIKHDLSDVSENIAMNAHSRKTRISKKNHSVEESGILKREYPSKPRKTAISTAKSNNTHHCGFLRPKIFQYSGI